MAISSKNQTAAERARLRELAGAELSTHMCESPRCPHPNEPVAKRELFPVVVVSPKRHTAFYHRTCSPTMAA